MKNLQLVTAAALALGGIAFAQQPVTPVAKEAANHYHVCPADKVLGLNLRNDAQKSLGEIGDLLVDPRSGEIRFAIVEAGGILGVGEKQRVVPLSVLSFGHDPKEPEKCRVTTRITEEQLKAAPQCEKGKAPEADLERKVETVFGKVEGSPPSAPAAFVRLSKVDGADLQSPIGKKVGEVKDLMLAPEHGCIAYAIVKTTDEAGDKTVALPASRLQYAFDEKDRDKLLVTTTVETAKLAAAPQFDAKDAKRMSSSAYVTELCTYYGCEPFWKTSRAAGAKAPEQPDRP